jgi:membrane protein
MGARLALVNSLAAEVAFLLAFALVPFLGVTIGMVGRWLPVDLSASFEEVLQRVLPGEAHIDSREVFEWARSSASRGWLTVGFGLALLTSFRFTSTCVRALGTIIGSGERRARAGWRPLLGSLVLLVVWGLALVMTALFLFVGPFLERGLLGLPEYSEQFLSGFAALRAGLVLVTLLLVVRATYGVVTHASVRQWRTWSVALAVAVSWVLVGQLLSLVTPFFWRGTQLYGTLGSVLLFLTWAYLCAWILLAGGLFLAPGGKA